MNVYSIIQLQTGSEISGGIANYISLLVKSKELRSFDHIVTVKNINKVAEIKYKGSKLVEFDNQINLFNFLKKVLVLKNIATKFKNTLFHSHALKSGFLTVFLKLIFKVRFVYTNHGLRFLQKNKISLPLFFVIEIIVMLFCEKYICVRYKDYYFLKSIIKLKFLYKKIEIIRLNLDSKNSYNEISISEKYKTPFTIIGIGSLIELKRPSKFIDWVQFLTKEGIPIKAYWFGEGPLKEKMIRLTELLNLDITWFGQKSQKIIFSYLKKATFLMQTSKFEVYSTVILESMSFGTPIISSYYWGVNELIKDNQNGVIIDKNILYKKQYQKLINLFNNEELYKKLSNNCIMIFLKYHNDNSKTSSKYKKIFNHILKS
tara:strand:- start:5403 stop:6524 length:1122 start_codon:yes stop_codon:yes gene_type:complete